MIASLSLKYRYSAGAETPTTSAIRRIVVAW